MCLAIFGFLVVLNQKIQNKPALLFSIYMIFNGLERFFIEFVRVNERYTLMGMTLSMSQFIAIAILLVGLIMTFLFSKKYSQSPT
jgi:phosphatidylglycerol:prolipoprotein diacylglycerol transferase